VHTCVPTATLPTINPIMIVLGPNPCPRSEQTPTDGLRRGTDSVRILLYRYSGVAYVYF